MSVYLYELPGMQTAVLHVAMDVALVLASAVIWRRLEHDAFLFAALAWAVDVVRLVIASTGAGIGISIEMAQCLNTLLMACMVAALWVGARRYPSVVHPALVRRVATPILCVLIAIVGIVACLWQGRVAALGLALVGSAGMVAAGAWFSEAARLHGAPHRSRVFGSTGFYLWAAVLPFSLLGSWTRLPGEIVVLVLKGIILTGIVLLLMHATAVLRQRAATGDVARRLVGVLKHELGTPIAEARIHIFQLLRSKDGDTRVRAAKLSSDIERIGAIIAASATALETTDGPSTQQRRQSREGPREANNVNVLVQTAVTAVKALARWNASWRFHYAGDLYVECVKAEVIQILIKVLRNSCEAILEAGRGEITVVTRLDARNTANPDVEIVVRDSGAGIAKHVEEHLFEEGTTTQAGEGRGYGLAIARDLVERNDGEIVLRSPISTDAGPLGTEVILRFPRASRDR